jgi:GNAT superfamily N-acetyltransferase
VANYEVERARPEDEHAAVTSLARAFHDDPLFNFFMPDLIVQAHGLLHFMGAGYADAKTFDEIWGARAGSGAYAGAAVWLPPGAYPRTPGREAMTYLRGARTFTRVGRKIVPSLKLLAAVDKAHRTIDVPHWYLAILGVDPCFQRTGAGTALLRPVLARCDEEATVAYLETQKPENVPWYGRHGFTVVDKLDVAGCPPIWTLLREPQPT